MRLIRGQGRSLNNTLQSNIRRQRSSPSCSFLRTSLFDVCHLRRAPDGVGTGSRGCQHHATRPVFVPELLPCWQLIERSVCVWCATAAINFWFEAVVSEDAAIREVRTNAVDWFLPSVPSKLHKLLKTQQFRVEWYPQRAEGRTMKNRLQCKLQ